MDNYIWTSLTANQRIHTKHWRMTPLTTRSCDEPKAIKQASKLGQNIYFNKLRLSCLLLCLNFL